MNTTKNLRNFYSQILETHLDSCKIFAGCSREGDRVNRSLNIGHRKSDSYDISYPAPMCDLA